MPIPGEGGDHRIERREVLRADPELRLGARGDDIHRVAAVRDDAVYATVLRQVLPRLIDALRLVIGPALVYLIAAEMVVGDVGFGYRIRLQSKLLNMSVVYPYLALLATFGFTMNFLLSRLQRKLCPWYDPGRE